MSHYICCITRMMFNSHRLKGTTCRGEPSLFDTHCCMCGYWIENQADEESANEQRELRDEEAADFERSERYAEESANEQREN